MLYFTIFKSIEGFSKVTECFTGALFKVPEHEKKVGLMVGALDSKAADQHSVFCFHMFLRNLG